MTFFKFLDNRYRQLAIELMKDYCPVKDGEAKAIQVVIAQYRATWKLLLIPKLYLHYLAIALGLAEKPQLLEIKPVENKEPVQQSSPA